MMKTRRFNVSELGYSIEQTYDTDGTPADGRADMAYTPETHEEFFGELEHALTLAPDYRHMYRVMRRTFLRCLDRNTAFTRLNLAGPFAKTDYLLKEGHADVGLSKAVNDTRVRLNGHKAMSDRELEEWHRHDFMHLCRFIAFLYKTDVPQGLRALFPTETKRKTTKKLLGECMRVVVNRYDNEYIYADAADGTDVADGEIRVCYMHGNTIYDYDRTYLRDLIDSGTQLNLIRPRTDADGTVYPELIIFEPDYLVDISAVARCFTTYSESPLVHLLRKLEPATCSQPTLLGNFAGQLLDETIQTSDPEPSYAESAKAFFCNNALNLITTYTDPTFHTEAQQQKKNIGHAMHVQLPDAVKRYDRANGMVEPSFFSEMLGLQGRMDYIQLDHGVIIEQKSGKGAFPYDGFIKPRHTEEHYVQILLYMLIFRYNFREVYERNNREMFPFLLYSKYRESLLGLSFAPELAFRALKMRNRIAGMEMMYAACDNGFRVLEHITAEAMNTKGAAGRLWEEHMKPHIEKLLRPIHEADSTERDYFFRMMTFVANEHMLSKLGNKTKENSGFAAKWHDSLDDKIQAGNIYCGLRLVSPAEHTKGHVETVTLRFADKETDDMSNFRTGDIVVLYPYNEGHEPDIRMSMVFRCTIEHIGTDTLRLNLRNSQTGAGIFLRDRHRPWAVEHDFFESSVGSLYRGLHAFLTAPRPRRDLLMLRREPETDTTVSLKGDYGSFNPLALRVKQARDMFLIIGPPGTGKTSFGMLNTLKEELLEEGTDVLVLSYTNRAVDEICSKLTADGIDFIRIGSRLSCAEAYRDHMLDARVKECIANCAGKCTDAMRDVISATRVFVGTTTALNANMALFDIKQFSLAIIDEASQILEPHLIGLLSARRDMPVIRKFVMIGDHKQLPAVVQQRPEVSAVKEQSLRDILLTDCRMSLFERMLRRYHDCDDVRFMLQSHGRMHPDIAPFPNTEFYGGRLRAVPLPHQTATLPATTDCTDGIIGLLQTRRIAFIAAELPDYNELDKVNTVEAEMIAATVVRIYETERDGFDPMRTVGVIVPYRNQIATIRSCIDRYGTDALRDITIDTVERYQGSQRRYIIYGFTIRRQHQLRFLTDSTFKDVDGTIVDRKLNVAMTRAEEHLIMFGHAPLLAKSPVFARLMDFIKDKKGFFEISLKDYIKGKFSVD